MNPHEPQSELLRILAHATRLAILDILREGEQCVCHMEATLGLRQAYISQQLMTLKQAGLVEARRDGLNLYYRVIKPQVFRIVDATRSVVGLAQPQPRHQHAKSTCPCPKCNANEKKDLFQIELPA